MIIKTKDITPSVYSKESRDFQLIGRLYDAVFNSVKMSIDSMINEPLSKHSDERFLDLVAKTLGFESKHNYNIENLHALCSSFKKIMFHKGTELAIEEAINMLLKAQNIDKFYFKNIDKVNKTVIIYIPQELKDVVLLEDLMNYILPAGFVYEIYVSDIEETDDVKDEFSFEASVKVVEGTSSQLSRIESFINSSLVTEGPKETSAISGKDYIEEKLEE